MSTEMKKLKILVIILALGSGIFCAGYRIGTQNAQIKPSYLAVSLTGDRVLNSVSSVVFDEKTQHYVMQGDEITFLSNGPGPTIHSTLYPSAFQFVRYDWYSAKGPQGSLSCVFSKDRAPEETFIMLNKRPTRISPVAQLGSN
jgi:hypothetical protein